MKAVYLTGFMGAGKTTVGIELGKSLSLPVIDTDTFIEEKYQKLVKEIFQDEGEAKFRQYESIALKEIPKEDVIVTTGGGIILQKENRTFMRDNGIVIFLYCNPDMIIKRLENDDSRPLLNGANIEKIRNLFANRLPLYKEADYMIDTTNLTIDKVVEDVKSMIKIGKNGENINNNK